MSPSTTRDTAVKWTAYALACLLLLFGHELTLAHLRVWGIAPFLPPLLPAVLASMEDRLEGFVFALAFGVLCDLALTAPLPCLYTIAFPLTALLAALIARSVLQPGILCSLAVSAILLYPAPAMVVLMSAAVFRERITRKKLLALALALLGCSFVTGVWSGDASVTAAGVLFGLGAGFLYALYSIFAPFGLRHYTPFTVVYWTFVFGGLGSLFLLDAGEVRTVFADGRMVLVALGLIVISTVLPYLLYTNGLARVESGKASILASLEPVVASFVGILAFGEPMSLTVFLGLGCILACVYVLR